MTTPAGAPMLTAELLQALSLTAEQRLRLVCLNITGSPHEAHHLVRFVLTGAGTGWLEPKAEPEVADVS